MHLRVTLVLLIAVIGLSACAEQDDGEEPTVTTSNSTAVADDPDPGESTPAPTVPPESEPSAESDDVVLAVDSSSAFGFDMFKGLAGYAPDDNVVTSPYSASVLLTMLLNGAAGDTRHAIGDVLHLDDPFSDEVTSQHQALANELGDADPDVEISIANSLWANEGTPFEEEYLNRMEDVLGALVEEINLGSDEAVDEIDTWVSEQTNERIEEMAEDLGVPDPSLVLILLNAIHFLGDWTDPFDPDNTSDGVFTTASGDEIEVPMMNRDDTHVHTNADGFQLLRLPYGESERFAMDILLPDEGSDITQFRDDLDLETWETAIDDLGETRVNVTLPRFELEYSSEDDLNHVLEDLGMGIAYSGEADFTPMSSVAPFLSTVVQKTYIRVDETGTEAAAVTGGAMEESMPPQFQANRPFIFAISDTDTGAVLFLGQVTDPSGAGE